MCANIHMNRYKYTHIQSTPQEHPTNGQSHLILLCHPLTRTPTTEERHSRQDCYRNVAGGDKWAISPYSYLLTLLLPGSWWSAQHEPGFESAGWWQKPTRRAWCKQCARCGIVKEYGKDFHKMQLGRGGECLTCKGGSRTTNKTHSSHWSAWFPPMQTRGMLAD